MTIAFSFKKIDKKHRIHLVEYDCVFTPQKNCIEDFEVVIGSSKKLSIQLLDCKGRMSVRCYNSNNVKIEEGNYINSLDLLKKYSNVVDISTKKTRIKIYSYYQPLRTGEWLFYDNNGVLITKKVYEKGILVDSLSQPRSRKN